MRYKHSVHPDHQHVHGPGCGHTAIRHENHIDYLHDGHLHAIHGDHIDECQIDVNQTNPDTCTPEHTCSAHEPSHVHGKDCGHKAVPHGEHIDYLVQDHLHHPHSGHCDDHGEIRLR